MSMNRQGRPTDPGSDECYSSPTFTGHKGLDHEQPLIFERGRLDKKTDAKTVAAALTGDYSGKAR